MRKTESELGIATETLFGRFDGHYNNTETMKPDTVVVLESH